MRLLTNPSVKYIALLALVKIVPTHPHLMSRYQDVILASVGDSDMSIRLRALDLLAAMVDSTNIQVIVQNLLSHLLGPLSNTVSSIGAVDSLMRSASGLTQPANNGGNASLTPAYRLEVSKRILDMCSRAQSDRFENFEWLLSVYVDLAYVSHVDIGKILKAALMQIVLYQPSIQKYAVKLMAKLLNDETFLLGALEGNSNTEVLSAAAWICGEYCRYISTIIPIGSSRSLASSRIRSAQYARFRVALSWNFRRGASRLYLGLCKNIRILDQALGRELGERSLHGSPRSDGISEGEG